MAFLPLFCYHFFDYKYNITYNAEDYDSPYRWIYMIFSIVSIIILCIIFRKTKKENVTKYLKIASVLVIALEIAKVSFESYWDVKTGRGLNVGGIAPFETCSMFMYMSAIAGYTKNEKVRSCCACWLTTIGFTGGMSNVLFPQGIRWYPFWTFGAFHSMIFHYMMVFTAMFLVVTKYEDHNLKSIIKAFIPHIIFSCLVITLDYIFGWNYMLYRDPSAVPLVCNITDKLSAKGLYYINTIIMIFAYFMMDTILTLVYMGVRRLAKLSNKQMNNNLVMQEN